jgi:hypothetical protein
MDLSSLFPTRSRYESLVFSALPGSQLPLRAMTPDHDNLPLSRLIGYDLLYTCKLLKATTQPHDELAWKQKYSDGLHAVVGSRAQSRLITNYSYAWCRAQLDIIRSRTISQKQWDNFWSSVDILFIHSQISHPAPKNLLRKSSANAQKVSKVYLR